MGLARDLLTLFRNGTPGALREFIFLMKLLNKGVALDYPCMIRTVCAANDEKIKVTNDVVARCLFLINELIDALNGVDLFYIVCDKGIPKAKLDLTKERDKKNKGYELGDGIIFDEITGTFFDKDTNQATKVDFAKVLNSRYSLKGPFFQYVLDEMIKHYKAKKQVKHKNLCIFFDRKEGLLKIPQADGIHATEEAKNEILEADTALYHHIANHKDKHWIVWTSDGDTFPIAMKFLSHNKDVQLSWLRHFGKQDDRIWNLNMCYTQLPLMKLSAPCVVILCILCGNDYFKKASAYDPCKGIGTEAIKKGIGHLSSIWNIEEVFISFSIFKLLIQSIYYYKSLKNDAKININNRIDYESVVLPNPKIKAKFPKDTQLFNSYNKFLEAYSEWKNV